MRVVFMGTPEFAVPSLQVLLADRGPGELTSEGYEIVAVVTQPDKPVGRRGEVQPPPVKQMALVAGLPVWQPAKLRHSEAVAELRRLAPDLIIVAAFGQILSSEVIQLPVHGCLNVHGSLLPKYRGAAPIAAAILAGEKQTGITIMLMDAGVDTGPMLRRRALQIMPGETTQSLTPRLAELGALLLRETLPEWLAGTLTPEPQEESQATKTRMLKREDGLLDWRKPALQLERQVRAYTPWPGSFTRWQGQQLKILAAALSEGPAPAMPLGEPGAVSRDAHGAIVTCGEGGLRLHNVQLEGKKALTIAQFLTGYPHFIGSKLG